MKKWIMKKLGIKEQKSISEEWAELGKVASEGFIEGLKTGIPTKTKAVFTDELFVDKEKSPIEHMNDAYNKAMDKTDTGKNVQSVHRDNHTIIDPLLKDVQETVWEQQAKVLASGKYDHPVHKDNHTAMEWSDHQLSEFADALVYHQAMKQTIMDVYGLISDAYMESVDPVVDEHLVNAMNRLRRR